MENFPGKINMECQTGKDSHPFEVKKANHIEIYCGEPNLDFQMGNFVNALDDLACYFENKRGEEMENILATLRFYCSLQERYQE